MLGELLGEGSGRVAGSRVLPTEGQQVRLEVTIQGSNKVLGVEMTETATYWQTIKPGGVFYGEGHTVMLTKDGEIAEWTGFGVGRPTGPGSCGALCLRRGISCRTARPRTPHGGDHHWRIRRG
jgi:hypothetical protein